MKRMLGALIGRAIYAEVAQACLVRRLHHTIRLAKSHPGETSLGGHAHSCRGGTGNRYPRPLQRLNFLQVRIGDSAPGKPESPFTNQRGEEHEIPHMDVDDRSVSIDRK